MTVDREKIISLARECNQLSIRATKNRPYGIYELTEEAIVSFYHAVRNEALEEAAELCDEKVCDEVPCGLGGKEIAAAIRAMKETK